jgi:hypothetical protein
MKNTKSSTSYALKNALHTMSHGMVIDLIAEGVDVAGGTVNGFIKEIALRRYPNDCQVLDNAIGKGATIEIITNALQKKLGVCLKSIYLLSYGQDVIRERERQKAIDLNFAEKNMTPEQ